MTPKTKINTIKGSALEIVRVVVSGFMINISANIRTTTIKDITKIAVTK